jgi:hypothetical protein
LASGAESRYVDLEQCVLSDTYAVPLLWFSLFRESDVRPLSYGAQYPPLITPIAPLQRCLENLNAAESLLCELFERQGSLAPHFAIFRAFLGKLTGEYLAINAGEIFMLNSSFQDRFLTILRGIGVNDTRGIYEDLLAFTNLRTESRFPPPDFMITGEHAESNDFWNIARLLGVGFDSEGIGRKTPWESGDA